MATLTAQDVKILEQTRQRLAQLTSQLANLQNQLITSPDPLPPWPSLHAQTSILSQTLSTLSTHLENNSTFFASTAIYPLPSYPGREQEGLLNQLLRKKLAPDVEEWVDAGQKAGNNAIGDGGEEWRELWEWAAVEGNELARRHEWGVEDEEEDGEDEEGGEGEKMQGVKGDIGNVEVKPLDTEQWLRFLSKGEEPIR